MSREQSLPSPVPARDEASPLAERLTALVMEARQEKWARRADLTHSITSLLEGLPSHPNPGEVVPTVHRLLEDGLLEGLEDGTGQSASVAATRALLALGYPHALEVSPEQLAALKHWERRTPPAPWALLLLLGAGALLVQQVCSQLGEPGIRHLFGASAAALAGGSGEVVVPTLWERVEGFIRDTSKPAYFSQFVLNCGAWVIAFFSSGYRKGRWLAMRTFQGIGAVGCLLALVQFPVNGWTAVGTLVSAGASLLAGRILRQ